MRLPIPTRSVRLAKASAPASPKLSSDASSTPDESQSENSKPRAGKLESKRVTRTRSRVAATAKETTLGVSGSTSARKLDVKFEERKPVKLERIKSRTRIKRGYAPPETYAHLEPLQDYLKEELDILFCGINPGIQSSKSGHHFAHVTNHFWRCLHDSGLTDAPERLHPSENHTLPERFNLGLTNIVARPSAEAAELSKEEFKAAVPELFAKIARYRPRIMCFVGKQAWEAVESVVRPRAVYPIQSDDESLGSDGIPATPKRRRRSKKAKFQFDIQPYKVVHPDGVSVHETLFFVLPSTSARVTTYQLADKTELFRTLKRRLEEVKSGAFDTSRMAVIPPFK
ncbi:DNA glycosylase [Laetiporus sulphureus 93-53]|uniref:DNA glycosylase n=1 Tax=Laetiporus sulphureus 93-53 TaxID=1314785 RepID=A0A165EXA0_9APHY|nr:DNA glycosylase [Laetiporus sulphureus 93-53]KZT07920.1 DNA glycosylase [Laetiporus sulphureus 93-53]